MMKKLNSIIIYTLLLLIIAFLVYKETTKEKVVYVDNLQLFSEFKMKKELEKKYEEVEKLRKGILDSLLSEIRLKNDIVISAEQKNELDNLKREFMIKKETFEKENAEVMNQYNAQIWTQLNEYTKQYGLEHNCTFIFGANGQGVLMFAADDKNVTKELVEYVNRKYNGK